MERDLQSQFRDMYWAGFTTMIAIVGLALSLLIGAYADKKHNETIGNENNTTEVI